MDQSVTQIPLPKPPIPQAPSVRLYHAWADPNPKTPVSTKVSAAIGRFVGKHLAQPREVICHPADAREVADSVLGVVIIGAGVARNLFLVGPLPEEA